MSGRESVTSREAAELLQVSVGTVLNMVERGQLEAWRTGGGHRRIYLDSVQRYIERRHQAAHAAQLAQPGAATEGPSHLKVLVVEDDDFQRALYRDQFDAWQLPVNVRYAADGVEGLIAIGQEVPDVLLIDLMMPAVDGFAVIRHLRDKVLYVDMDIIAISGLSDEKIAAAGGLPSGVALWPKPIPFAQLRGFLDARILVAGRWGRA